MPHLTQEDIFLAPHFCKSSVENVNNRYSFFFLTQYHKTGGILSYRFIVPFRVIRWCGWPCQLLWTTLVTTGCFYLHHLFYLICIHLVRGKWSLIILISKIKCWDICLTRSIGYNSRNLNPTVSFRRGVHKDWNKQRATVLDRQIIWKSFCIQCKGFKCLFNIFSLFHRLFYAAFNALFF